MKRIIIREVFQEGKKKEIWRSEVRREGDGWKEREKQERGGKEDQRERKKEHLSTW